MATTMTTTQSMATSSSSAVQSVSVSSKQMLPDYLSAKALLDRYSAASSTSTNPIRRKMPEEENQAEIDLCRPQQGQSCGSIQDLLESFHTAFSDDQLWAIVFQFITLYRNAIILNCRSSSRASSSTTTQKQESRRKTSSSLNLIEKNKTQTKKSANSVQKLNLSTEGSTGTSGRGSDSECGSDVDVEASDNSDIISELMMLEQEEQESDNSATMIRRRNGGGKSSAVHSRAIDDNRGGINNRNDRNDSSGSDEDDQYTEEEGEELNAKEQRRSRRRSSRNVGLVGEKPESRCMEHQVDYLNVPTSLRNFRIHKDGSVHVSYTGEGEE